MHCCALIVVFLVTVGAGAADSVTPPPSAEKDKRTKAEIEALVEKEGTTPPSWWESVQLNYPQTLDLSMAKPPPNSGWNPQKNVGQYFWSVINENSSKWKEGIKFAQHVATVNKDDPEKVKQALRQVAHLYQDCLQDYARAAYFRKKCGDTAEEDIAVCYWKLGSREMAKEVLTAYGDDDTRHGTVIKLWADMGEIATALKLAEIKSHDKTDIAWLMAGEACRLAGRIPEALDYYNRVLKADQKFCGRDFNQSKKRAQASIDAIKVFDSLDLKLIPDGKYQSSSAGYTGPVTLEVTVKANRIEDIKVTQHTEKQYYGSLTETPRQIIAKQSVKGIDTFSSATITSEAIINATAKALAGGMKPVRAENR
jgi:uncharacterized protein with FMN-binding domain/uncharacterized protein YcnI